MNKLTSDQVEWVVNDMGELGVKIRQQFFFLYKGRSLDYGEGYNPNKYENGSPIKWRYVGKREFGETCQPWHHVYKIVDPTYRAPAIPFPETYVGFHKEESDPDFDNPWQDM